jgi:hypothetical protein
MKKTLLLWVASLMASPLFSQLIFSDDFSTYTNTALSGQGSWTNSTSTWGAGTGTSSTVSSTALTYAGYGTVNKSTSMRSGDSPGFPISPTPITSGSVYIAFMVDFNTVPTTTTVTQGQVLRFRDAPGTNSHPMRLCANSSSPVGSNPTSFKFSLTKTNTSATSGTYDANQVQLIVMKYTVMPGTSDDIAALFVNPTIGATEPAATVTITGDADIFNPGIGGANQIQGMHIYGGFDSGGNPTGQIGGFRVSTTWAGLFPTCFPPTAAAISSITTTTASLNWSPPTSGAAVSSYDYEISTTNSFTGTPTVSGVSGSPVNLTGLTPGTTYYVKVRSNCGSGDFSAYTNTTTFTTLPACPTPSTPTISSLAGTSAALNWSVTVGSGQTTPTGFDYENILNSGAFGGTPTNATSVASSPTTMTESGAAGSTTAMGAGLTYKTQVRSNCGSGIFSAWSSPVTYTTTCNSFDISSTPYTQGFNTPGVLDLCWSTAQVTGSSLGLSVAMTMVSPNGSRYEGGGVIQYNSYGVSSGNSARLISPTFTTMGMSAVEVSFYMTENYNSTFSGADNATLEYSIDGGTNWTTVGTTYRENTAVTGNARWSQRFFLLPSNAINQTNLKVALKCESFFGMNFWIDAFKIGAPASVADNNLNTCHNMTLMDALSSPITATGRNMFRIFDGANTVMEINPNGNNLGTLTLSYRDYTAGVANVPVAGNHFLPRSFVITPSLAGPFTTNGGPIVKLFFSNTELTDYKAASGLSSATMSTLRAKKYSGVNQDCDMSNDIGAFTEISGTTGAAYGSSAFYLQFQTTTFSEFAVAEQGVVILPVEFLSVKATKSTGGNRITWSTATEKNVTNFRIERSADGQSNWTTIALAKAAGNSTTVQNYAADDNTPLSNISYYRIVAVDQDGKLTHSKVVSVLDNKASFGILKVYPNPTDERVNLDIAVPNATTLTIEVIDILGRVVKQQAVQAAEGTLSYPLSIFSLGSGTYTVKVQAGAAVAVTRVVKL